MTKFYIRLSQYEYYRDLRVIYDVTENDEILVTTNTT